MKIPVSGMSIGTVSKKDIMRCTAQLEKEPMYAMILAFDVTVEHEAQKEADKVGIKIFTANVIYHLFAAFTNHVKEEKEKLQAEAARFAIFPCRLLILPGPIHNNRNPHVVN